MAAANESALVLVHEWEWGWDEARVARTPLGWREHTRGAAAWSRSAENFSLLSLFAEMSFSVPQRDCQLCRKNCL